MTQKLIVIGKHEIIVDSIINLKISHEIKKISVDGNWDKVYDYINQSDLFDTKTPLLITYQKESIDIPDFLLNFDKDIFIKVIGVVKTNHNLDKYRDNYKIIDTNNLTPNKLISFIQSQIQINNIDKKYAPIIIKAFNNDNNEGFNLLKILINSNIDIKHINDFLISPKQNSFTLLKEIKLGNIENLEEKILSQEINIFLWCLSNEIDKMGIKIKGKWYKTLLEIDCNHKRGKAWLNPLVRLCQEIANYVKFNR